MKLVLEYDGAAFHGWQSQPGVPTVQEELHRALETVLREPISEVIGSGRTDAGVHARAQVANVRITAPDPDLRLLKYSVSSLLKGKLSVVDAEIVSDDFHARFDAVHKTYRYAILYRDTPPVLDRGRVWHIHSKLNIERMQVEAQAFVGKYDCSSFQGAGCQAKNTEKEIFASELEWQCPYLSYTVCGSGFLKHMVRNMVGTLVGIGKGDAKLSSVVEVIEQRKRTAAGITAPAQGLSLVSVHY